MFLRSDKWPKRKKKKKNEETCSHYSKAEDKTNGGIWTNASVRIRNVSGSTRPTRFNPEGYARRPRAAAAALFWNGRCSIINAARWRISTIGSQHPHETGVFMGCRSPRMRRLMLKILIRHLYLKHVETQVRGPRQNLKYIQNR